MDIKVKDSDNKGHQQEYDLGTFKVLIVEDFHFVAGLLSSTLKEMGVGTVATANDGINAKTKILNYNKIENRNSYDAIILDWLLPEMSGEELLKWMREHTSDSIRFLPVIICSSYATTELVEKTRDLGATEVMVKPVSAQKLAQRLQYVIDKPRPYIKSETFFGPDRRRKVERFEGKERRVTKAEDVRTHHEQFE